MMLAELIDVWQRMEQKSIRALAKDIGCDHSTLWRFLHDKPIEADTFSKILTWVIGQRPKKQ